MESSSPDESNGKSIDPTVGGLVWVRRRNGSWWPGRIMGMDELPEDCLVSPRSGTPVKLLGRDDASVDWYNLERSKRVKAFRCGEYDDCIEKAKAAANSNKKAVKYARREDAILHALEIESASQSKDCPDLHSGLESSRGGRNGRFVRDSSSMSEPTEEDEDYEEVSTSEETSSSAQELSQSGISFEEPNHVSAPKAFSRQGRRRRTPNDSEDDGTEGTKRMRGLEDLGIGVVSKRKAQTRGLLDQVSQDGSSNGDCNGSKGQFSSKRKRSLVANVHEFLKRKSRRRPLMKVLESSTMVTIPVMCEELDIPGRLPGLYDSKDGLASDSKRSLAIAGNNSSDSNGPSRVNGVFLDAPEHVDTSKENEVSELTGLLENDSSDGLYDVPFVRDEKPAGFPRIFASSLYGKPQFDAPVQKSSQSSHTENMLMKIEGIHESVSTSSAAAHDNISQDIEKGTSMWQSKGKRNSRHASKQIKQEPRNSEELDDESDDYTEHLHGSSTVSDSKLDLGANVVTEDPADGFPDWRKRASRRELHMRGGTAEAKLLANHSVTPQRSLPYRQSRFRVHPKLQMTDFPTRNIREECTLYDVKLEVKASYRPQHVPLVSLMSKLNGKAIIGHPLTVEALDDGSCDELMNNIEWYPTNGNCELDDTEEDEHVYAFKPNYEPARIPPKHSTSQPRFSPGKSSKTRRSGLLSKKTRRLSSLTGFHKLKEIERNPMLGKPKKGPAVACVPLKVVFSRLKEAVSGSTRPVHHVLMSSNP